MKSVKVIILMILASILSLQAGTGSVFKNFISVQNGKLMDGDRAFHFYSMNIPNLLLIEDNMAFNVKNPWRLPNGFEIRDALLSIKQMGGKACRTYVITVKRADDLPGTPKHVLGPGLLNERAFLTLDSILAVANELGIRLIIPLVDNWKWMGGRGQYAAFRGKQADDFWSNEQIKEDFKATIAKILNRKNTLTGISYKEDKAIMIWELGNELRGCPLSWIEEMAAFVKSIDGNHLINDGRQNKNITQEVIDSPYIDVLSSHHYEGDAMKMLEHIGQNLQKINGRKPYYLGEFGFISTQGMRAVLEKCSSSENLVGALLWSLRFHNRNGGFYWHSEPFGGFFKAYHWPGFNSGSTYDEQGVFALLEEFNRYDFKELPEPLMLPSEDAGHLSWQGATGACQYQVQRAESENGPWQSIGTFTDDAQQAYVPLFNDGQAQPGKAYYYRVKAYFPNGATTISAPEGPIKVKSKWLIDNCDNLAAVFRFDGRLTPVRDQNRSFKEDLGRLQVKAGTSVVYRGPGKIIRFKIRMFRKETEPQIHCSVSQDGRHFKLIKFTVTNFAINQKDYDYWQPLEITGKIKDVGVKFLKIGFKGEAQLGRVEVEYQ